jgi:hypothetical protein
LKRLQSVIVYDAKWPDIKITEQYALSQAVKLLPNVPGILYLGFPWAALIDRLHSCRSKSSNLVTALSHTKSLLREQKHVITVCQHIDLLKYRSLLAEAGVTHVFWTHMCEGINYFSKYNNIKISPFPFASAQLLDSRFQRTKEKKYYYYSFIELDTNESYPSQACDFILTQLANDKRGLVISQDQWKFGKFRVGHTYTQSGSQEGRICGLESVNLLGVMQKSVFTLCPSMSGPNSVRLWESIGCGSIPVIFGDTQFLPGSKDLWDEAIVLCSERKEDILDLPDHLEAIAKNEALLERKRHAMRQLWILYGPNYFIYDIHKLFIDFAQENFETKKDQSILSYGRLLAIASAINRRKDVEKAEFDSFILGCNSRVISDPSGFKNRFEDNREFRMAYKKALSLCNRRYYDSMQRNLKFKGLILN